VKINGGVPHLDRRHDPEAREIFERIPRRALASAARLKEEIKEQTQQSIWVQAVVVFWAEFPEGYVQVGKCTYVEGSRLRGWLEGRPQRLSETEVREIGDGVARIAEDADASTPARA
jgi:hypothetical protein